MAIRFYLRNVAAPYTPATLRGAWDASGSAVTKLLDSAARLGTWDTATSVAAAETNTNTEWDVLLYRGVTGKLKAGTIGTGTVNVMLPFYESNAAADFSIHLHIYVTQGDSDTPRGTLLTDYRDGAGANELTASNSTAGIDLNAAQSLSSLAVSDNDRIVVEIGYVARNPSATSYTGTLYYGQTQRADLAHGGAYNSGNAYVEFSEAFEFVEAGRVSQGPVETLLTDDGGASRVSQGPVEVLMTDDANPARVTQAVAEILQAQSASARLTQLVVELLSPVTVASRVTQMVAELLTLTVIESRHTQIVAEILDAQTRDLRLTQFVIEVLGKSSTYCGPPSLSPAALCGKPDVLAWLEWTVPMREN